MSSPDAVAPARGELTLLFPLRLLASVAIVWHHMRGSDFLGLGFGLPLFLVILFGLTASGSRVESLTRFGRRRWTYLLVPWLRWSIVYVVVLALADQLRGRPPTERLDWNMLLSGGHASLWFLPFAACASLVVKLLQGACRLVDPRTLALAAAAAGLASSLAVVRLCPPDSLAFPFDAWLRMLPSLPYGLSLAAARQLPAVRVRRRVLTGVAALALAGVLFPVPDSPESHLMVRFASAMPLACLGFAFSPVIPGSLRWLAALNFGVYLIHPLVGKLLVELTDPLRWPGLVHLIVVWGGAALVLLALRRLRPAWQECRGTVRGAGPAGAGRA